MIEDAELYAAYFKKEIEYYLNKLEHYRNGKKHLFNGYAFLFGIFWFMYRKMYLEAVIIIVAIVTEGYLEEFFTAGLSETAIKVISRMSTITVGIIVGMFANDLYIRKAESVIAKAKAAQTDQESLISHLEQKGGVSFWFLIVVLFAVAGIIWYFYHLNNQG